MNKLLGGILLVAGTTIGGAMLVLPVLTAGAGFVPSIILLLACWFFLFFSAFLILEVALKMPNGANMITMATYTLGRPGKWLSWVAYLLLLYCLTAAYLAGSGELIAGMAQSLFHITFPGWLEPIPMLILFALFVYMGAKMVDYSNRIFMAGLIISYLVIAYFASSHFEQNIFAEASWSHLMLSAPVIATSFGFHIVIPSLVQYLDRDIRKLRICLTVGATVPLVVYLLWQTLIYGMIPIHGENSLISAWRSGGSVTVPLIALFENPTLTFSAHSLHAFAILTSFLGVTFSLADFLTDGLKLDRSHSSRLIVTALTFLPPLFFVWTYPRIFAIALEYAGIFVAVLLGILPICMVWVQRYKRGHRSEVAFPGGRGLMVAAFIVFLIIIALQVADAGGFLECLNKCYL